MYDKARSQQKTVEDHYAATKARIEKIQSQLDNTARGDKLRGKVCVITGVGSLKGIGYVITIPVI
jgi:ferritin-like metal-binding protein YciE